MIQKFKSMGVINITPDSFSDGGQFDELNSFEEKFNELKDWANIIDIGAESTAPFNDPISEELEFDRFKTIFFPYVQKNLDPSLELSIDTYKPSVFKEIASFINKTWPDTRLIWNDVSGVVDDEMLSLIHGPLKFKYVLSHNLCKSRLDTTNHMNFIDDSDKCVTLVSNFFKSAINAINSKREILLDPCFGFSKTRKQNHQLLNDFPLLFEQFQNYSFVYGISRKSFLRFPENLDAKNIKNQARLDQIQTYFIVESLLKVEQKRMIFRIHDGEIINAVNSIIRIREQ